METVYIILKFILIAYSVVAAIFFAGFAGTMLAHCGNIRKMLGLNWIGTTLAGLIFCALWGVTLWYPFGEKLDKMKQAKK
jgi:hypothetical protein